MSSRQNSEQSSRQDEAASTGVLPPGLPAHRPDDAAETAVITRLAGN